MATKTALGDSTAQVRSEIPDVSGFLTIETDPSVPSGTQAGEMQYWNGTVWVTVAPASSNGQTLYFIDNRPQWGPSSDTPGHGNFITTNNLPNDWRSPQNDNLWQVDYIELIQVDKKRAWQ